MTAIKTLKKVQFTKKQIIINKLPYNIRSPYKQEPDKHQPGRSTNAR